MTRFHLSLFVALIMVVFACAAWVQAQNPASPPQTLPGSVTLPPATPPAPVSPAALTIPANKAPIARFQELDKFPPETVRSLYSLRAAADWVWRMNQVNGKFLNGLNPALRMPIEQDNDLRQAYAAWALARSARFTGDQKLNARAVQSVMTLLTLTKAEAGCRMPTTTSERCNRVGLASLIVLAIHELPDTDEKLIAQADELCAFLAKQTRRNGAIDHMDTATEEPAKADPEGAAIFPGLALRALVVNDCGKEKPKWKNECSRAIVHQVAAFRAKPNATAAANLIPAWTEYCLNNNCDKNVAAVVYEAADWLCGCQYSPTEARSKSWVGGFRQSTTDLTREPDHESAICTAALIQAIRLTRNVPDLSRYQKYRTAAINGLIFSRSLQFTEDNADHFEKAFRSRCLLGGVHLSPTDGNLRIDATAHLIAAEAAFLTSGAEGREE